MMALYQIHLFESRKEAFHEDEVLQETVIIHAVKETIKAKSVKISISDRIDDDFFKENNLPYEEVVIDSHGKMPDVIIYFINKNWLVLIEAVTSHGLINPKRKNELIKLFKNATIPLVMVTSFLNRQAMMEYLSEIAWETDVWIAEDATHLIHFNGEHLLQS
ncbi:MAG: BsuBI/PstI family type II restriction endonuclease [Cyanobacteria bacterium P01_A01_bin.84]